MPSETDHSDSSLSSSPINSGQPHALATKPPSFSHCHQLIKNISSDSSCITGCHSSCLGFKIRFSPRSPMAHGNHDTLSFQRSPRKIDEKKNGNGQQRRLNLEQEVDMLQKELENEEKAHDVLEQAIMSGITGSSLHIPSFLPKKVKELLAELVMVEEEISRLEEELKKNKQRLRDSQEGCDQVTPESTKKEQEIIRTIKPLNQTQGSATPSPEDKIIQEKLAKETGPLFFISQAINGDYTIHNFTHMENIRGLVEKNNVMERHWVMDHQESHPWKSGIIEMPKKSSKMKKSFSPRLYQVHPMTTQPKTNSEFSINLLRKPSSISSSLKENNQKRQPNKLSEEIMKCLICIFLRLIRTSRVTELEKSGNLLRTTNLLLKPGIFRVGASLNLTANFNTQREKSQQDPYGIFEIEDSLVRDIGPYKNLVRFTSSHLDSKGISNAFPLLNKLRVLLKVLHEVDIRFLTPQQKLAFWINMYNTCIMHGFLEHGFPSNPQKVVAFRNKVVLNIGGKILSALEIEHFILRQSSNIMASWEGDNNIKEQAVRSIYGLEHSDPNVLFALCCGNKSSPVLKIYTADSISTELEKSRVEYLQASIVVIPSKRLMIPKLLHIHMHDFAEDLSSLLDWICQQLPTSGSLRKCITQFLRGKSKEKISDIVDIIPYDFDFQFLLPIHLFLNTDGAFKKAGIHEPCIELLINIHSYFSHL